MLYISPRSHLITSTPVYQWGEQENWNTFRLVTNQCFLFFCHVEIPIRFWPQLFKRRIKLCHKLGKKSKSKNWKRFIKESMNLHYTVICYFCIQCLWHIKIIPKDENNSWNASCRTQTTIDRFEDFFFW